MLKPPKKPKMSKERYEFLENIRTNDPRYNGAIIDDYPDEWADFNIAYKYYNYRISFSLTSYKGQNYL